MVCLFKTQRGARAEKNPLQQGMVIESGCELRDCNRMQFMRSRCRIWDHLGPIRTECLAWQRGWMSAGSRQWSDAAGSVTETKKAGRQRSESTPGSWLVDSIQWHLEIQMKDLSRFDFSSQKFILSLKKPMFHPLGSQALMELIQRPQVRLLTKRQEDLHWWFASCFTLRCRSFILDVIHGLNERTCHTFPRSLVAGCSLAMTLVGV